MSFDGKMGVTCMVQEFVHEGEREMDMVTCKGIQCEKSSFSWVLLRCRIVAGKASIVQCVLS